MDNLIFLYGENEYLIQKEIKKLVTQYQKKESVDNLNTFRYDFKENNIDEFLEELSTSSFFTTKKIFVLKNFFKLALTQEKLASIEQNITNPDNLVIITNDNLIIKNEFVKILDSFKKKEVKLLSVKELYNYAAKYFVKFNLSISEDALNLLLERTKYNISLIDQEISKLILYKYDDSEINIKDISICLEMDPENEIFNLVGYFLTKNNDKLIKKYHKLVNLGNDPSNILYLFAKSLSQIYLVKRYIKLGYNQDICAKELMISSGKVYYLARDSKNITEEELIKLLNKLALIDYNVKIGLENIKSSFELFLLGGYNND